MEPSLKNNTKIQSNKNHLIDRIIKLSIVVPLFTILGSFTSAFTIYEIICHLNKSDEYIRAPLINEETALAHEAHPYDVTPDSWNRCPSSFITPSPSPITTPEPTLVQTSSSTLSTTSITPQGTTIISEVTPNGTITTQPANTLSTFTPTDTVINGNPAIEENSTTPTPTPETDPIFTQIRPTTPVASPSSIKQQVLFYAFIIIVSFVGIFLYSFCLAFNARKRTFPPQKAT